MIPFKFRIDQFVRTLSGNSIIKVFLPDTVIRTRNTVLPHTVRTAPQPTHTCTFVFRIREGKPEVKYGIIRKSIIKAATARCPVQQYGIHLQQPVRTQTTHNGIRSAPITDTKDSITSLLHTSGKGHQFHLHSYRQRTVFQRNYPVVFLPQYRIYGSIVSAKGYVHPIGTQRYQRISLVHATTFSCSFQRSQLPFKIAFRKTDGIRTCTHALSIQSYSFQLQNISLREEFFPDFRILPCSYTGISGFTRFQSRQIHPAAVYCASLCPAL